MPAYRDREDARRQIHEIAGSLRSGAHGQEADGFRRMYLLGNTDTSVEEFLQAPGTEARQAGEEPGPFEKLDGEAADALEAHDLGDADRLEEDTVYWDRVVGTAAEKLGALKGQRLRAEAQKQMQLRAEMLKSAAASCMFMRDAVCGEYNPYRYMFGGFAGVRMEVMTDTLGELAETVAEVVLNAADSGLDLVLGDGQPEDEPEAPENVQPQAPYVPVREDDFVHRNTEPEPVAEEEILRANEDLLSEDGDETRRWIGYDGLVKEEQEAMDAAHPERAERAERARQRARSLEAAAQKAAQAGAAPDPDARQAAGADPAPPVRALPSDDTPPVLVRPEDKKLSGPRVMKPRG